ncbi:hypothetical protein M432DRAFT_653989 [Thermoascus aurantiacus ATCC 26904]
MDRFLLTKPPCANVGNSETQPCPNAGSRACSNCYLVQYCSTDCQRAHWPTHKRDCKSPLIRTKWKPSWEVEGRRPAFVTQTGGHDMYGMNKYLWGNMPALDMLNLERNEGSEYAGTLDVLFAASGDIRNIVKTLASLPENFHGKCNFVVNDKDFDVVSRNVILLLTSLHYEPAEATPMLIHMWYSALIPEDMLRSLRDNILPLIEEVSLRLVLRKEQWSRLRQFFEVPKDLSVDEAQGIRKSTVLAPHRKDYLDRFLFTKPPAWRVCAMKFREHGVLLPFGATQRDFDTPNPTLYRTKDRWPMKDSADPLEGWPLDEVISKATLAKKDIYGSLFFYLQDLLSRYCRRLGAMSIIHLFHLDAVNLPSSLKNDGVSPCSFDRIEVSNISDSAYLGPGKTLSTFNALLKPKPQSMHATLLCLFLNAVEEACTPIDTLAWFKVNLSLLRRYLPTTRGVLDNPVRGSDAEFLRLIAAADMSRDFDELFDRYMLLHQFPKISRDAGLEMKARNTIVLKPFPMQLRENASQEEFDLLHASGHDGHERI